MNNVLGMHVIPVHNRPGDLDYCERLQPAAITFVDADAGQVLAYAQRAPGAWLLLRDWALSEQHEDARRAPVATGERHAAEWVAKLQREYGAVPQKRVLVHGLNEPPVWDGPAPWVQYTVAFLDALTRAGVRAVALNLSVGWPANHGAGSAPDWSPYEPVQAAIKRGGHWLGLHEYWDHRGPGVNWGWWAGRYLACPWHVPIVIGECGIDQYVSDARIAPERRGWQGQVTATTYAAQMAEYVNRLDRRVVAVCPFTTDYGHPWASFDTTPAHEALAAIRVDSPGVVTPDAGEGQPGQPVQPTSPGSTLAHPMPGAVLTQHWGENGDRYARYGLWGHNGTDLAAPAGTPVRAMDAGHVAFVGDDADYGRYVRVSHADAVDTFYAHLATVAVSAGQTVQRGQTVGTCGNTGNSTGAHLHLEVRLRNGDGYRPGTPMGRGRVDPETYCILRGLRL